MITCRVIGPVSLDLDGAPAPPELLWRKNLALLVYLARSPKRARTREHLTGLLWPEKEESAARHSLNEALRVLRRAVGDEAVEATAGQVRLAESAVWLDADELERHIADQAWDRAAAIVAGEFLEGFAVAGADAFEEWLAAERRHWKERSLVALLRLSEFVLARGLSGAALTAAMRAEALDPYSDLVARATLTALAVQGDSAAAVAHYERFAALLLRDLSIHPAEPTRVLAERIRGAKGPRPPLPGAGQPERRRAPLVGRGRELATLLSLWEACRSGPRATALVLEGDSGSGKTRLLEEFASRVRLGGGTVALIRAVEADLTEPGRGLLGLGRGGLLDAPGLPAASPEALAAFAASLPEWAERFRPVAGAAAASLPLTQAMLGALEAALEAGPLLLVVDDAQWVDPPSLLALIAALRDFPRAPLGLVFAALPEPRRAELDELRRRLGQDVPGAMLSIGPLDAAALRELAAWALPGYDAVALERVSRRVASDSAGLPILAVELLSAVAQGLDLQQGASAWPEPLHTLTQSLPGQLPDTVVAAVRIGFRRLSQGAQQVLSAAAVLDGRVTEALLARMTGQPAPALQAALDELEWQRWLEADGQGYGFVARLARRVIARDMLTPGQRARFLERAGVSSRA
jgi:DNA-binding SARP family transcriptional activator